MLNQRWPRVRKNGREADIGGNIAPRERLLTGHLPCIGISGGIPKRLFGTCHVLLIGTALVYGICPVRGCSYN